MKNVYIENGFENRKEYLHFVAEEYGVDWSTVYAVANALGSGEDFDGLISSIQDMGEF